MANKAITRFEIQYVFGEGDTAGYLRWVSTRTRVMTGADLIAQLRRIADQVERAEETKATNG